MIHTIVYISNAVTLFEEGQLENLFRSTNLYNNHRGITGILIYRDGTFMQILEGRKDVLVEMFKTIEEDSRHNNIIKILERDIDKRLFHNYQTAFSGFNNLKELDRLENFLKEHEDFSHSQTILALLGPFINERYA